MSITIVHINYISDDKQNFSTFGGADIPVCCSQAGMPVPPKFKKFIYNYLEPIHK
jgi:hypothetical protein